MRRTRPDAVRIAISGSRGYQRAGKFDEEERIERDCFFFEDKGVEDVLIEFLTSSSSVTLLVTGSVVDDNDVDDDEEDEVVVLTTPGNASHLPARTAIDDIVSPL